MEKTIPLKQDPEFVMPKSGLDGIYHIELSAEEYQKENENTKVDPVTH